MNHMPLVEWISLILFVIRLLLPLAIGWRIRLGSAEGAELHQ
jgi:hypothetical protein